MGPVSNIHVMEMLDSQADLLRDPCSLALREAALLGDPVKQLPTLHALHHHQQSPGSSRSWRKRVWLKETGAGSRSSRFEKQAGEEEAEMETGVRSKTESIGRSG